MKYVYVYVDTHIYSHKSVTTLIWPYEYEKNRLFFTSKTCVDTSVSKGWQHFFLDQITFA